MIPHTFTELRTENVMLGEALAKIDARCQALEEEADFLRDELARYNEAFGRDLLPPKCFGTTPSERLLLSALLTRDVVPTSILNRSARVQVSSLRKKLGGAARIKSIHRGGYMMPAKDRDRLLSLLSHGERS